MRRNENGNWTDFTPQDRDDCGKQYYLFDRRCLTLGFLSPPWEKLPEDVRESYRAASLSWIR